MNAAQTAAFLKEHDNYLILTHVRPDGDTLGSGAALCRILRKLGYTGQYVRVRAAARPGELCRVRIDGAEGTLALGAVIEHEQEEDTDE